jgi:hypothetical protein
MGDMVQILLKLHICPYLIYAPASPRSVLFSQSTFLATKISWKLVKHSAGIYVKGQTGLQYMSIDICYDPQILF